LGFSASSREKERTMSEEGGMGQVIQIDEGRIRDHLGTMVRGTVEETSNAMLDAEADRLCGAVRYERSEQRPDTRAGSYERTLETRAGEVTLRVPKLRRQTFETAIIERYRRRESLVEEALIEMYLAGVSVRRVEDITEAPWGTRVSPSTMSNLNKKIYAKIEAWRQRRIEGSHPYLYLDGIAMKPSPENVRRILDTTGAEYARGPVHANSAEGFNDRVRRTRRARVVTKPLWARIPPACQLPSVFKSAVGRQLRRILCAVAAFG
jgi:hypothetical protein